MFRTKFAASLIAAAMALPMAAHAEGDVEAGEKVFKKCKACHQVGPDASNKTGPILNGIVGRAAGSIEDFKYSKPMQEAAAGGLVWSEEELAKFLEKPKDYMAGTKMSFAGLKKEDDRADVIAYLATFQ